MRKDYCDFCGKRMYDITSNNCNGAFLFEKDYCTTCWNKIVRVIKYEIKVIKKDAKCVEDEQ